MILSLGEEKIKEGEELIYIDIYRYRTKIENYFPRF